MATVYVAGPMRGLPNSNFDAFDAARDMLGHLGYTVISPADIDRKHGDSGQVGEAVGVDGGKPSWVRKFARRDVDVLVNKLKAEDGDAVAILPGCDKSIGCSGEVALARWVKLKFLSALTGQELTGVDPIAEVNGEALNYTLKPATPARWVHDLPAPPEEDSCGCGGVCYTPGTDAFAMQQIATHMANTDKLPDMDPDSPFMQRIKNHSHCGL